MQCRSFILCPLPTFFWCIPSSQLFVVCWTFYDPLSCKLLMIFFAHSAGTGIQIVAYGGILTQNTRVWRCVVSPAFRRCCATEFRKMQV